jgi:hypothetical protein
MQPNQSRMQTDVFFANIKRFRMEMVCFQMRVRAIEEREREESDRKTKEKLTLYVFIMLSTPTKRWRTLLPTRTMGELTRG